MRMTEKRPGTRVRCPGQSLQSDPARERNNTDMQVLHGTSRQVSFCLGKYTYVLHHSRVLKHRRQS